MLFVEFHGSPAGVAEQSERFGEIAGDLGGGPFEWTTKPEDRTRLWQARHDAYWAGRALRPGAQAVATDVCVPISRLAECVTETQRDIADSTGSSRRSSAMSATAISISPCWSTWPMPAEVKAAKVLCERLVERALAMDGTCTGEHGVGQGKMKYLAGRAGRAGARRHGCDQAGARSRRHHESGKDRGDGMSPARACLLHSQT